MVSNVTLAQTDVSALNRISLSQCAQGIGVTVHVRYGGTWLDDVRYVIGLLAPQWTRDMPATRRRSRDPRMGDVGGLCSRAPL